MKSKFLRAVSPVELTYITFQSVTTGASSYTFTNVATGVGNIIVAAITEHSTTGLSISSLSIGGVNATQITYVENETATNSAGLALYRRVVTTSPNTIIVNWGVSTLRGYIGVWRINNYESATPLITQTNNAASGTGLSVTLTPAAGTLRRGSAVIAASTICDDVGAPNCTWTGVDENFDSAPGLTRGTGGSRLLNGVFASHTVSTSHTNSTQPIALAAVLFR